MNFFTLLTKILFEDAIGGGTPPVHTTSDNGSPSDLIKSILLAIIFIAIPITIQLIRKKKK